MPKGNHKYLLPVALLSVFCILLFSAPLSAQDTGCNYDKNAPSLDNARLNFKSLNYRCAELELLDLQKSNTLTLQEKADVYVLLAAVYYAMLGDDDAKRRDKVIEQFTAAFRAYREWKGTLEITSSEFAGLMEEAKQRVDSGEAVPVKETPMQPMTLKKCPSSMPALVGTGIFGVSAIALMVTSSNVNSKWDDYEADPTHPTSLYDDYKSANSTRNVVGVVTAVSGVVTAYLWIKYFSGKSKCSEGASAGLDVAPSSQGIQLTYRF